MKTLRLILLFVLAPLVQAQVPVTANHIQDGFNQPIALAKLCFVPVDATRTPVGFRVGVDQIVPNEVCGKVTSGVLQSGLNVASTVAGVYYHVYLKEYFSNKLLRDYGMTPITAAWSLDPFDSTLVLLPVSAITIGTVATVPPGTGASCVIAGSGPYVLNCNIPKGDKTLDFTGLWSSTTNYQTGEAVSYNNAVYISLVNSNLNNTPSSSPSDWALVVSPASVTASPNSTQTITQPSGTTLQVSSLNGALNATLYPGTPDIGVQVNNAIAALPATCGSVYIPTGSYNFATTINKPRCVKLVGAGAQSTILNWTPMSGTAVKAFDTLGGQFQYPMGYIADLTLSGTGLTNTAIGLFIGDLTSCTTACGFGDHQSFDHIRIMNFGTGIQWGQNAWSNNFHESLLTSNGVGLYFPTGLSNSGEGLDFFGTVIQNNTIGLNLLGFADFYFYGGSCDYNTSGCGNVNAAQFYGVHFEQLSGYILTVVDGTSQPHVEIIGGWAQLAAPTGTDPAFFFVNSATATNPYFKLDGVFVLPVHTVTNLVNWHGSGGAAQLIIEDLPYSPSFAGNVSAYMNAPCNFFGCRIQDNEGAFVYTSANSAVTPDGVATYKSVQTTESGAGARLGADGGFGGLTGNAAGLTIRPIIGSTKPMFLTDGFINASNTEAIFKSIDPIAGSFAPSGACTTAGQLVITGGDGHATYCKASTMVWTTLY
jgi:hypothetical protein